MARYKDALKIFWRPVFVLLCLVVTALLFHQFNSQEGRCGACVLLVGSLWASEALPLEVTSLLPILLLPLLGIMSTGDVSKEYFTGANMMMMAAMGIAAAVQNVRLHQRIALGILMMTGAGKKTLLLSFMVITCGISMFICNTATCAMMCPILKVVLDEVYKSKKEKSADTLSAESEETQPFECCEASKHKQQRRIAARHQKEKVMFYLGVAYAANIGGTGTLTASEPNVIMKGILEEKFPCQDSLTYTTWMAYAMPSIVVNLTFTFLLLSIIFWRAPKEEELISGREMRRFLRGEYDRLGPFSWKEFATAFYFVSLVTLWFFQEPQFMTGWGEYFGNDGHAGCSGGMVGEATPAVLILVLLFITPSRLDFWPFVRKMDDCDVVAPSTLLDWESMASFFPWGLLLIRGGGFALAKASNRSGLSVLVGSSLTSLESLPPWGVLTVTCLATSIVTEICSNAVTANILLPVLGDLAVSLNLNPLYLMLPAAVTCCYAFMLPVACPTNAIVYKASGMKSWRMVSSGVGLNLITLAVSVIAASTYGCPLLQMHEFPIWANTTDCSIVAASYQ